jgi:hypothetical protein
MVPIYIYIKKKTGRDSLLIDMLLSAVSVLDVAQSSSEIPGGLTNYPVFFYVFYATWALTILDNISAHSSLSVMYDDQSEGNSYP